MVDSIAMLLVLPVYEQNADRGLAVLTDGDCGGESSDVHSTWRRISIVYPFMTTHDLSQVAGTVY